MRTIIMTITALLGAHFALGQTPNAAFLNRFAGRWAEDASKRQMPQGSQNFTAANLKDWKDLGNGRYERTQSLPSGGISAVQRIQVAADGNAFTMTIDDLSSDDPVRQTITATRESGSGTTPEGRWKLASIKTSRPLVLAIESAPPTLKVTAGGMQYPLTFDGKPSQQTRAGTPDGVTVTGRVVNDAAIEVTAKNPTARARCAC